MNYARASLPSSRATVGQACILCSGRQMRGPYQLATVRDIDGNGWATAIRVYGARVDKPIDFGFLFLVRLKDDAPLGVIAKIVAESATQNALIERLSPWRA